MGGIGSAGLEVGGHISDGPLHMVLCCCCGWQRHSQLALLTCHLSPPSWRADTVAARKCRDCYLLMETVELPGHASGRDGKLLTGATRGDHAPSGILNLSLAPTPFLNPNSWSSCPAAPSMPLLSTPNASLLVHRHFQFTSIPVPPVCQMKGLQLYLLL